MKGTSLFQLYLLFVCLTLSIFCKEKKEKLTCHTNTLEDITKAEKDAVKLRMDLTLSEKVFLWRYLSSSHSYYEFGCGGATILACKRTNIKKLEIIDTSWKKFHTLVNVSSCINQGKKDKRIILRHISIGPVDKIGSPIGTKYKKLWRNYPESILNHTLPSPDVVYIDGRFRLLSALMALYKLPEQPPLIIMHDFFNRSVYWSVLRHMELLDCVGDIALLSPKEPIDRPLLVSDIKKYFYRYE